MLLSLFYTRDSTHKSYYHLVSLEDTHACHITVRNRQTKTRWLAEKVYEFLEAHTKYET
jgi:hypothetical protein